VMKIEYGFTHEGKLHKFATPRAARAARFQFTGKIGPAAEIITFYTPVKPKHEWPKSVIFTIIVVALIVAWGFGLTGDRFDAVLKVIGGAGFMVLLFASMWLLLYCVEKLLDFQDEKE
jgi:hypothetical protein